MKDPMPLLSQLFDGTLTEAQAAELRAAIKNDPRFADEVVLAAALHSDLRDLLAGQRELGGIPNEISGLGDAHILPALAEEEEVAAPQQAPTKLKYVRFEPRSKARLPGSAAGNATRFTWGRVAKWSVSVAAAAALIVGVGVGIWSLVNRPVAAVANVVDVQWAKGQTPMQAGDSLSKSRIAIAGGLLRLTFACGASVVAQGPAELQIDSATSMRLLSGRLTTSVPHDAIGFTVETPAASVIDLGTEVGIKVADDNQTHVEVFKGRAKVDMPDVAGTVTMASAVLDPAMAVNVQARGTSIEKTAPQPLAFIRQAELLERAKEPENPLTALNSARMQMLQDPSLLALYTFDNQGDAPQKLLNRAPTTASKLDGTLQNAIWDQGRLPGVPALRFTRNDSGALVNIPGNFNQLTLAAWVNFDVLNKDFAVLFAGDHRVPGSFDWKFAIIDGVTLVNIGVAAETTGPTHYIGGVYDATGLTTGSWHFCVFNYDLDAKALRCRIDGHWLKVVNGKHVDELQVPAKIDAARIGNELRYTDIRAFHGRMDEFAIWNRTLSDDEIDALYHAGTVH